MRTLKELLILFHQYIVNQQPIDFYGMCGSIFDIKRNKIITSSEYTLLKNYIEANIPYKSKRWHENTAYWWKPRNKPPRLRWCSKHIKIN